MCVCISQGRETGERRRRSKQIKLDRDRRERHNREGWKANEPKDEEERTEQMQDSWRGQASRHLRERLSILLTTILLLILGLILRFLRQLRGKKVTDTYTALSVESHAQRRSGRLFSPPDLPRRSRTGPGRLAIACCSRGRVEPSDHGNCRVQLLHKLRYYT